MGSGKGTSASDKGYDRNNIEYDKNSAERSEEGGSALTLLRTNFICTD